VQKGYTCTLQKFTHATGLHMLHAIYRTTDYLFFVGSVLVVLALVGVLNPGEEDNGNGIARVVLVTVPRISRLMALAIRFDHLIKSGEITDQADLARLGHVTRARVTQIMNLLQLAPDIQEEILFLPRTIQGHDPIHERHLRPIAAILDWRKQRRMWQELKSAMQ